MVDARPAQDKRRGADSGVDGYVNFFDDNSGKAKRVIVQVKSGHVSVAQIRDLKGVLNRENAQIGVFITLNPPTRPMTQEAASTGFYVPDHFPNLRLPRLQILTLAELFSGREALYPRGGPQATFKQAVAARRDKQEGNRARPEYSRLQHELSLSQRTTTLGAACLTGQCSDHTLGSIPPRSPGPCFVPPHPPPFSPTSTS